MDLQKTVKKTEISVISATAFIEYLKGLEKRLSEIQKAIKPKPETELLTRQETAKLLDVSLPTLHSWTKKNILQAYRIGNKVRYKKDEVLKALHKVNHKIIGQ